MFYGVILLAYANYLGNKSASKYRHWAHGISHAMIFLDSTRYVPPMTNMLVSLQTAEPLKPLFGGKL